MPDPRCPVRPRRLYGIVAGRMLWLLVILIGIFVAAGRVDYWQGWGYGATVALCFLVVAVVFAGKPEVIVERAKPGPGMKRWDRLFYACYFPTWAAILAVAALDTGRFGWSPGLPVWVYVAAYVVLAASFAVLLWSMWTNRFFSSVVRIQADRGQHVVTAGPYRFVRHPGYVGILFLGPASALMLGSLWALLPAAVMAALLLVRTALEDATLRRELHGYADYARKVRCRLLPGIW